MFVARFFNRENLFQRFGGWTAATMEKKKLIYKDNEKNRRLKPISITESPFLTEHILFQATCAYIDLIYLKKTERECINQFKQFEDKLDLKNDRLYFHSPTIFDLFGRISSILNSIRIMQNITVRLLKYELNEMTLPDSMHKLINNEKHNEKLPNNIKKLVNEYWDNSGKKVKQYRDIIQHHYPLVRKTYLQISPEIKIIILLPDNPDKKAYKDALFNEKINAIDYIRSAFYEFHDLLESLSSEFGYEPKPFQQELRIGEYINIKNKSDLGTIGLMMYSPIGDKAKRINLKNGELIFDDIIS